MSLEEDAQLVFQKVRSSTPYFPGGACKRSVIEMYSLNPNYRPVRGQVLLDNFMGYGARFPLIHYWIRDLSSDRRVDITAAQLNGNFYGLPLPDVYIWSAGESMLYANEHMLTPEEIEQDLAAFRLPDISSHVLDKT